VRRKDIMALAQRLRERADHLPRAEHQPLKADVLLAVRALERLLEKLDKAK